MENRNRCTTGQSQALRGALLGACDLEHAESIDEREIVAGTYVGVRAAQGNLEPADPDLRAGERVDQRAVDVGDEIAEVIDRDDGASDVPAGFRRCLDPAGDELR